MSRANPDDESLNQDFNNALKMDQNGSINLELCRQFIDTSKEALDKIKDKRTLPDCILDLQHTIMVEWNKTLASPEDCIESYKQVVNSAVTLLRQEAEHGRKGFLQLLYEPPAVESRLITKITELHEEFRANSVTELKKIVTFVASYKPAEDSSSISKMETLVANFIAMRLSGCAKFFKETDNDVDEGSGCIFKL